MSQQFAFWRTDQELDPSAVSAALTDAETVPGLDKLDLDGTEQALIAAFPEWSIEDRHRPGVERTMLSGPDGQGGVDARSSPQSVIVDRHGTGPDEWNRVIEAMVALGLPLFDPQIDARFDQT